MANYDWENGELDFLDIVTILSLCIGIENNELNKKQLRYDKTDKSEELLNKIIEQNAEIIRLLKEIKNDRNNGI